MKKAILTLLNLLLIASCTFGSSPASTPGPSPTLPNPQVTTIAAPDAEGTVRTFLDYWNERAFGRMYEMLSPLTTDSVSRTSFLERYEDVAIALSLIGVDYEIVSSLVNPQSAQVRYRLTLKSAVLGDIHRETWIDLTRVDNTWKVAWTSESILPELSEDKKLLLAPIVPTRAGHGQSLR